MKYLFERFQSVLRAELHESLHFGEHRFDFLRLLGLFGVGNLLLLLLEHWIVTVQERLLRIEFVQQYLQHHAYARLFQTHFIELFVVREEGLYQCILRAFFRLFLHCRFLFSENRLFLLLFLLFCGFSTFFVVFLFILFRRRLSFACLLWILFIVFNFY